MYNSFKLKKIIPFWNLYISYNFLKQIAFWTLKKYGEKNNLFFKQWKIIIKTFFYYFQKNDFYEYKKNKK